jgi:hypothetical protein
MMNVTPAGVNRYRPCRIGRRSGRLALKFVPLIAGGFTRRQT